MGSGDLSKDGGLASPPNLETRGMNNSCTTKVKGPCRIVACRKMEGSLYALNKNTMFYSYTRDHTIPPMSSVHI